MTPKEKAKELVDRFKQYSSGNVGGDSEKYTAKQCALICVEEILKIEAFSLLNSTLEEEIYHWEQVKQEIQKL